MKISVQPRLSESLKARKEPTANQTLDAKYLAVTTWPARDPLAMTTPRHSVAIMNRPFCPPLNLTDPWVVISHQDTESKRATERTLAADLPYGSQFACGIGPFSDPGFSQRFMGKFNKGRKTITEYWEKSTGGKRWEHDLDVGAQCRVTVAENARGLELKLTRADKERYSGS
jgi:hypothetical protein